MSKSLKCAGVPEVEEHISVKYDIKKRLGKGAYGIVWKAVDRQTGEVVAVKKIFDAFRNKTDAQEFGDHPNVIKLQNVVRAQNDKDIYLIFEYMDSDLHAVIKKGTLLKDIHKRYVMYQLLKAVKYLHSGNVIHRDHKPSNVLVDSDCVVKLCDFGLARSLNQFQEDSSNPALTEYVATRWYRAPEILLGSTRYTKGVDMWSLGCILGEMLLGKALFPGTSTINQIEKIMTAIPHPCPDDVLSIKSEVGSSFIRKMLLKPQVPLEDLLQASVPPDAVDLLKSLLVFNPDKRLTADTALQHPYVARFHNPAKEPSFSHDVTLPLDDDVQLSVEQYRNKLYQVISERRSKQSTLALQLDQTAGKTEKHGTVNASPPPLRAEKHGTVNASPPPLRAEKHGTVNASPPPLRAEKHGTVNASPPPLRAEKHGTVNASPPPLRAEKHVTVNASPPPLRAERHATVNASPPPLRAERHATVNASPPPLRAERHATVNASPPSENSGMNKFTYNPITHTQSGFMQTAGAKRPAGLSSASTSPTGGVDTSTSMEQIIQRGRSAPANHGRSFSLMLTQAQNNPLVRKKDSPLSSGLSGTCANPARPPPRFSKKVFQNNCNVSAAGDPRAKLGSYCQAYGTISKTELDHLLQARTCNQ
ncbi:mitogen-activated protein kinase 15-like isoform X2 [Entelurus aequoreus]|uniref:mitogen-activated protein kinase 15-like isoform X2 n=1 Tax=Entelurus aequoreus TaxID=161455 RepID=UPI002B1CFB44|nr:mitogen-activated protein kinase 15-like isoform X2 [Entelurus aequoreus]